MKSSSSSSFCSEQCCKKEKENSEWRLNKTDTKFLKYLLMQGAGEFKYILYMK